MTVTTLNDYERAFLIGVGVTPGTINDMWMEFLGSLGHTGTLNDRKLAYWEAGGGGAAEWTNSYALTANDNASRLGYIRSVSGALVDEDEALVSGYLIQRLETLINGNDVWFDIKVEDVPDTDATFKSFTLEGTFQGGKNPRINTYLRSDRYLYTGFTGTTRWKWTAGNNENRMVQDNVYNVVFLGDS